MELSIVLANICCKFLAAEVEAIVISLFGMDHHSLNLSPRLERQYIK